MKKYKIEIQITKTYIVDVLAENEQEATDKATEKFAEIKSNGMEHYHEYGDNIEEIGTIYDVTNTDDPFNE